MAIELSQEGVEQALKGFNIPPRPTLLVEVDKELKKPDPDLRAVATLVGKDVGISAAMLKTVNSPFFGLRSKVGNVSQAVQLLGARNVRNIVTGLVLRGKLGGNSASLERFWDASEKVASINVYLCSLLPKAPRDEAYTFGIFHDCGIPVLMQRFANYRDTLRIAGGDGRPLTVVEDERHGTNHATLGYMVARSWGLSDAIAQSILLHHDPGVLHRADDTHPAARTLVAVNFFAEHLNDTSLRMRSDAQWESIGDMILEYLGLTPNEYSEIREDVIAMCA